MIECPNCRTEYFVQPHYEELEEEEINENNETLPDEFEEGT